MWGIHDVSVKMASYNSCVKTTAELISLFTTYVKISRKRPIDTAGKSTDKREGEPPSKNFKPDYSEEKCCLFCKRPGHIKSQCYKFKNLEARQGPATVDATTSATSPTKPIQCTYCKKVGHVESACYSKQRAVNKPTTKENGVNLLQ